MKDFWVKYRVTGEVIISVEANTPEEAKEKADEEIYDKEFYGIDEVEDIEAVYVENEKGELTEFQD